jgi:hypothetical protein
MVIIIGGWQKVILRSVQAIADQLRRITNHLKTVPTFTRKVDEALCILAAAIREEQNVSALPHLHEALHMFEDAAKSVNQAPKDSNTDPPIVLAEVKRIARNIMNQFLSPRKELETLLAQIFYRKYIFVP